MLDDVLARFSQPAMYAGFVGREADVVHRAHAGHVRWDDARQCVAVAP